MGQVSGKPGHHILRPGHVVTEASLRRELAAYADLGRGMSLSARKAKTFLTDMAELLQLPPPDDLLVAIDTHGEASYSLDECVAFFLSSVPADDSEKMLSESLKDHLVSQQTTGELWSASLQASVKAAKEAEMAAARRKKAAEAPNIDVQTSATIEAFDEGKWSSPAQYFSREWSLVLSSGVLS